MAVICPYCQIRPANLHLTVADPHGQVQCIHIYHACAQQRGFSAQASGSELLTWLEANPPQIEHQTVAKMPSIQVNLAAHAQASQPETDDLSCPNCGITWTEFMEKQRLGCAHDYVVFREKIDEILEQIHGAREHQGRLPGKQHSDAERQLLTQQLEAAVLAERFEDAARIRDRLAHLNHEHDA